MGGHTENAHPGLPEGCGGRATAGILYSSPPAYSSLQPCGWGHAGLPQNWGNQGRA